ncbi:VOC family protein [Mucilaginibacter sp. HC2]|uniref:VOC family protein n=1 Tax=Mucilaginibacter inviolabilis TaxID=2714892 RepID=UPI00140B2A8C|nr:VOC family protein [Mucilaginibacter inviolabilis]NHA06970.1 VOC family protein [Mucilaginibacter inviolabilis]
MKNVINWFEIYTSDFNRAKKFYSDVFKCQLNDIPMNSDRHSQMYYATFLNTENKFNINGALVKLDEAKPGIGGTLIYFATEEITAELNRVEPAGGKIIRPKLSTDGFGFIALIQDTEGNMIGLHSER